MMSTENMQMAILEVDMDTHTHTLMKTSGCKIPTKYPNGLFWLVQIRDGVHSTYLSASKKKKK